MTLYLRSVVAGKTQAAHVAWHNDRGPSRLLRLEDRQRKRVPAVLALAAI